MRSWIRRAKVSFRPLVVWTQPWRYRGAEGARSPLCWSEDGWGGLDIFPSQKAFLWRFSQHVELGRDPGADPEFAGAIAYPIWPRDPHRRSWKRKNIAGERDIWNTMLNLLPLWPNLCKMMDGWFIALAKKVRELSEWTNWIIKKISTLYLWEAKISTLLFNCVKTRIHTYAAAT